MARQKVWFKVRFVPILLVVLLNLTSVSFAQESHVLVKNATGASDNASTTTALPTEPAKTSVPEADSTPGQITTAAAAEVTPLLVAASQVEPEHPPSIPHFIHKMMIRFGEAKAAEALKSLDQLSLGLVMKILLVEMDKDLATDIVAMQRYAQGTDKALITMIGRIVAGDKNVPKEIFAMDLKLMKFPWWVRIRERMLNNLEKYIAAYSLVPVAAKSAVNGASKSPAHDTSIVGLGSELSAAVAASATESSNKVIKQVAAAVAPNNAPSNANSANLESLKVSLLNPLLQQQQLLGTLALAKAAAASNVQAQQLLLKAQQASNVNINPFLLV